MAIRFLESFLKFTFFPLDFNHTHVVELDLYANEYTKEHTNSR
jgi:hypothetical protein